MPQVLKVKEFFKTVPPYLNWLSVDRILDFPWGNSGVIRVHLKSIVSYPWRQLCLTCSSKTAWIRKYTFIPAMDDFVLSPSPVLQLSSSTFSFRDSTVLAMHSFVKTFSLDFIMLTLSMLIILKTAFLKGKHTIQHNWPQKRILVLILMPGLWQQSFQTILSTHSLKSVQLNNIVLYSHD